LKTEDPDMSTREAAMKLRVELGYVYQLIWSGKLAARRERDGWRISAAAVDARISALNDRAGQRMAGAQ
jgi:excisionase family DNA binding protein